MSEGQQMLEIHKRRREAMNAIDENINKIRKIAYSTLPAKPSVDEDRLERLLKLKKAKYAIVYLDDLHDEEAMRVVSIDRKEVYAETGEVRMAGYEDYSTPNELEPHQDDEDAEWRRYNSENDFELIPKHSHE